MSEVPSLDTETQKSYKEYLLKQLLDNPQSLGLDMMGNKDNKNEGMKHNHHTPNVELKLDSIGNKKVDGTKNDTGISNTNVINMEHIEKKQIDYDWSKQYDQSSCCYYYYNFRTGLSQWEQPDNYMDTSQYSSFSSAVPVASDATSTAAVATFNARTGSFTSSGIDSYWQQVGRQTDREGRQMSAFFDMQSLEENREEAKRKKKQLQEMKGVDWRKYKEERKKKRAKISQRWLYEDEA